MVLESAITVFFKSKYGVLGGITCNISTPTNAVLYENLQLLLLCLLLVIKLISIQTCKILTLDKSTCHFWLPFFSGKLFDV